MKNQYFGDIGDYGKYGLLRFLAERGVKIGVNWYLTPDDGSNDGKILGYLKNKKDRQHDPELFDFIGKKIEAGVRSVSFVEEYSIVPGASYYNETVGVPNRTIWHQQGLKRFADRELVFCDPDNGTIGKKSINSKGADKYIAPLEIADYYNQGQNVVYYCQRARRTNEAWLETKTEMKRYLPNANIYVLTFHRGTQRSYVFVLHPEDYSRYTELFAEFEQSSWFLGELFTAELVESEN